MKLLLHIATLLIINLGVQATTLLPVTELFAHNEADNFDGKLNDIIIGSGMNGYGDDGNPGWPSGEGLPSTWVVDHSSGNDNRYQAEWQSRDLLSGATNNKIGWAIFDLGSVASPGLEDIYLWHIRENSGRVATTYNVYTASSPSVAPIHGPTTNSGAADYDFASGGWALAGAGTGTFRTTSTIGLGGVEARYVALEILTNGGDGSRVGFAEIAITQVPEPSSALLGSLGLLGILLRRRR